MSDKHLVFQSLLRGIIQRASQVPPLIVAFSCFYFVAALGTSLVIALHVLSPSERNLFPVIIVCAYFYLMSAELFRQKKTGILMLLLVALLYSSSVLIAFLMNSGIPHPSFLVFEILFAAFIYLHFHAVVKHWTFYFKDGQFRQ